MSDLRQTTLNGLPGPSSGPLKSYQQAMGDRGIYDTRNRLNDLTGREWVYSTRSVWPVSTYPKTNRHDIRVQHGGQKPPEFCADLIRIWTKEGQRVLDPFAGVGGVLLGATLCGRQATGIELSPRWADIYRQVCASERLPEQQLIVGDARVALPEPTGLYDLVLTDPPYWDMDSRSRSEGTYKRAGMKGRGPVKSRLNDFGNAPQTLEEWRQMLLDVFTACRRLLKPGGYAACFMGDMYHSGRYWRLTDMTAQVLTEAGYTDKGSIVWVDTSKDLHTYGYLYQWIPSMVHQEILVFRNEN